MPTQPKGHLKPHSPSMRDQIAWMAANAVGGLGADKYRQQWTAKKVGGLLDFLPGVGEAIGADETKRAFDAGNYGEAALNAGTTALGAIPGGGDMAAALIKAAPFIPPGAADKLKTGWIFKDVQMPHKELSRADNKQISNYVGVREETIPVRSIYATQENVNPDYLTTESSSGELPFVIRKNGNLYAQDGHHRIMRAANDGAENVRVRFMDLDHKDTETPLLNYRAPTPEDKARDKALLDELFAELTK